MKPDLSEIPQIERGGPVPHLSLPHRAIVDWHDQQDGESIRAFVDRNRLEDGPPIVVYELDDDGKPTAILRAEWHRPIAEVRPLFVSCPMTTSLTGGTGSKSVLGVVAMIGLMAVSSFATGFLAPIIGQIGASLVSAAMVVGGGLLISQFLKVKSSSSTTTTYEFSLGNNSAKPGEPIPVRYGRRKFMPDFADAPWSDYDGLNQTYHVMLCLGVGEFDIEEIGVNTTPIWSMNEGFREGFGGDTYGTVQAHTGQVGDIQGENGGDFRFQIVGPGGVSTLFPSNVSASSDVNGQELPEPYGTVTNNVTKIGPDGETSGPDKLGPFIINAAGTVARSISIDLQFPSGFYHVGSNSSYRSAELTVVCEYRYVDDQGHELGSWQQLFSHYFNFMSRSSWRETIRTDIEPGRVEVRLWRTTSLDKDGQNSCNWIGARAYVDGPSSRANVTQLAIRAKADKLLSGWSSQKLYVVATRRIPTWDDATASWIMRPTRNPFWAMADLWADTRYGGGRSRNKLDIPTLRSLAAGADDRGDYFDHAFTSRGALVDHLTICAQAALAQPLPLWDTLSAVRDERRALPRTVLTDFEIIRGTLKMSYTIAQANAHDGVVGQYFDSDTWAIQEVSSTGTVGNLQYPSRVTLEGITDRDQAYRHAIYLDRVDRYRRSTMSIEIEGEGRLLKRGDLVVVSSELPGTWGASVRIDAYDLGALTLTLHAAVDWTASGQRYIRIKGPHGEAFGPVKCGRYGQYANVVSINPTDLATVQGQQALSLSDMLWRPDNAELPSAVISIGAPQEFQGLVHEISAGSQDGHIKLDLTPYVPDLIYADPEAALTPLATAPALVLPAVPGTITGLGASLTQNDAALTLTLNASWQPDSGSESYEAQYSTDGSSWSGLYDGSAATFSIGGFSGATIYLRVRGRRGNLTSVHWSQVTVAAPALVVSLENLGFSVRYDDLAPAIIEDLGIAQVVAQQAAEISALEAHFAGAIAANQAAASAAAAQTGVTTTQQTIRETNAAFASYQTVVSATIGTINANITSTQTALATAEGSLAELATTVASNFEANSSSISQLLTSYTTLDAAFSSLSTTLSSSFATQEQLASLSTTVTTQATALQSLAAEITTMSASFASGATVASLTSQVTTQANAISALSASLTQFSAESSAGLANGQIGFVAQSSLAAGVSAEIQMQVSTTVGGTMNFAGFMIEVLNSGASYIIANSERFALLNNATRTVPFISNADGSISIRDALIGEASIGTLKLGGNAVIIPINISATPNLVGNGTWQGATNTLTITNNDNQPWTVYGLFNGRQGYTTQTNVSWRVYRNGSTILDLGSTYAQNDFPNFSFYDTVPVGATHVYQVMWNGANSNVTLPRASFMIMGCKR